MSLAFPPNRNLPIAVRKGIRAIKTFAILKSPGSSWGHSRLTLTSEEIDVKRDDDISSGRNQHLWVSLWNDVPLLCAGVLSGTSFHKRTQRC